jgi:hypothetical protein
VVPSRKFVGGLDSAALCISLKIPAARRQKSACPRLLPAGAGPAARVNGAKAGWLFSHRHPALGYRWSMMFSENRYPLFGIML